MSLTPDNQDKPEAQPTPAPATPAPAPAAPPIGSAASRQTATPAGDRSEIWKRGLVMLIFMMCFEFGQGLLIFITVVQFIWLTIYRERNDALARFGKSLGRWLSETAQFLTCFTENKPFPWAPWPNS